MPVALPSSLRKEQAAVAELVPEVTRFERRVVRFLDEVRPGDRFEEIEMRRVRAVPPGNETVDDARRTLRSENEIRPPIDRAHGAVGADRALERARRRRPDRDDTAAAAARVLDESRRRLGDADGLRLG